MMKQLVRCGLPLLIFGGLLLLPESALAAALRDLVTDTNSSIYTLWSFSRSLINYLLVGFLIVVAFANVLRINIDSYAVKKVLPTLIMAFFAANFSLFFAKLMFDIVDSLNLTAGSLAGGTGTTVLGATPIGQIAEVLWEKIGDYRNTGKVLEGGALAGGAIAGVVAGIAGVGNIVAVAIGIIVFGILVLFPLLVMAVLWVLLHVRFYVLQVLIGVAPMAIILAAFPFSKNLFSSWLKQFFLWIFMLPAAYFLTAAGLLIMSIGFESGGTGAGPVFAAILTYVIGIASMVGAITVPFQMGGWVTKGLLNLAKSGFNAGRAGLAIGAARTADKTGWRGALHQPLKSVASALYVPDQVLATGQRYKEQSIAESQAGAASIIKDKRLQDKLMEARIHEHKEEIGDSAVEMHEKIMDYDDVQDRYGKIAVFDKLYSGGDRSNWRNKIKEEIESYNEILAGGTDDEKEKAEHEFKRFLKTYQIDFENGTDGVIEKDVDAAGNVSWRLVGSPQALAILSMQGAGAKMDIQYEKDATGNDVIDPNTNKKVIKRAEAADDDYSQFVAKRRETWDKYNKKAQFYDESGTLFRDKRTGKRYVGNNEKIANMGAYNLSDLDPQRVMGGMNKSSFVRELADGSRVMDTHVVHGIAKGQFGWNNIKHIDRLTQEAVDGLKLAYSKEGYDQMESDIHQLLLEERKQKKEKNDKRLDAGTITAAQHAKNETKIQGDYKDNYRERMGVLAALEAVARKGGTKEAATNVMEKFGQDSKGMSTRTEILQGLDDKFKKAAAKADPSAIV